MAVSARPRPGLASGGHGRDLDVAVIGAGPHGLSAATHLRRRGVEAHVFGSPMGFWSQMPEGMMLRSSYAATNMVELAGPLSLDSYAHDTGAQIVQPVKLEDFISYGRWVQAQAVPDVDERNVDLIEQDGEGFRLELQDGSRVSAGRVVVACGISPFERMPEGFSHLPGDRISHTARHRDLSAFAGRRVLVVGGGQSAFECAVLMKERGAADVEVLARSESVVWLRGHAVKKRIGRLGPVVYAPTDVGPLWYSRLVEKPDLLFRRLPRGTQNRIAARSIRPACSNFVRVRLDGVKLTTGLQIAGSEARDEGVLLRLTDGSTREVDHVMFGTGYRVDIARYGFLGERLLAGIDRREGYPVLSRGLESSVAGLHFMGAPAAWSFGPIMRFVSGSWYGGSAVATRIGGPAGRRVALARGT